MQSNGRAALAMAAVLSAADAIAVRRAWAPDGERTLVWLAITGTLGATVLVGWFYQSAVARLARGGLRLALAGLPFALLIGGPLSRTHLVGRLAGAASLPFVLTATIPAAALVARWATVRPTRAAQLVAFAAAASLLIINMGVRQPVLRATIVSLAVALLVWALAARETERRELAVAAALACVLSSTAWAALRRSPNVNFVTRAQAPLTGLVLGALARPSAPQATAGVWTATRAGAARYADANLVLITIDALRADAPLPALDAAAPRMVRLDRVYAQAPHTAWSIASLLTGAHPDRLRGPTPPPTLAERLGARHFYTDAFYPAGFFFDGRAPLGRYAATRFGFEWSDTRTLDAHTLTDAVLARLDEERRQWADEPRLFLWAHYFDPHEPYVAHDGVAADAPARARYRSEVAFVDGELARLVRGLASLPRPTLVVVTADHGEEFGEHGGAYHGTTVYDEQVRVPLRLFVVGGAPLAARALDGPVELVDVAPTLLELLGLAGAAEGHSLLPQLDGAPVTPRDAHAQVDTRRMIVRDGWKLIRDLRGDVRELYDLARDPHEQRNLAGQEPARLAALDAALSDWFDLSGPDEQASVLTDEQAPVERRVAAARALGIGGPPVADQALRTALAAADPTVRAEAALALAELSDDAAVAPLLLLLDDPHLRRRAALGLGHLRDPRALPALREALTDIDPTVRRHAVHYLGWLGDASDGPRLRERALADLPVRADAYLALGRLGARTGAAMVKPFLESRLPVEEYADARARLVEALRLSAASP